MYLPNIINNLLPWDNTYLGSHQNSIVTNWEYEGNKYYGIVLSLPYGSGIIYCSATKTKDLFPCIVEDIKEMFGLTRRGIHRITIDNTAYILYFSQITTTGQVVWDTPLNRLPSYHPLRQDISFRKEIQKIVLFREILAIKNTGEQNIVIRITKEGQYLPISINEKTTSISKGNVHDFSIITKTLISKWFDEDTSMVTIAKELSRCPNIKIIIGNKRLSSDELVVVTSKIRNNIENIIKKYNEEYIWYNYFIIERLCRYLLDDENPN